MPGLGFLYRESKTFSRQGVETKSDTNEMMDTLISEDEATLDALASTSGPHQLAQYIVYAPTFQVPALYFTIHNSSMVQFS